MKRKHLLSRFLFLDITMKFDLSFSVCLSNHNNNFFYIVLSHIFCERRCKILSKRYITRLEVFFVAKVSSSSSIKLSKSWLKCHKAGYDTRRSVCPIHCHLLLQWIRHTSLTHKIKQPTKGKPSNHTNSHRHRLKAITHFQPWLLICHKYRNMDNVHKREWSLTFFREKTPLNDIHKSEIKMLCA